MNILDFLVNVLPHFDFFLDLRKVVFAYNTFNKVICHLSSSHIEIWNYYLADEHGLICLQLINRFKLLLERFDFSVDFTFTHGWFTRYFAYNRLEQSRHHTLLPCLLSSAHVIEPRFGILFGLLIQFENLLLNWVMLFASRILHRNNTFLYGKKGAEVLEEIIIRFLDLFETFVWLWFAISFRWFSKIKNINLIFLLNLITTFLLVLSELIKKSASVILMLIFVTKFIILRFNFFA